MSATPTSPGVPVQPQPIEQPVIPLPAPIAAMTSAQSLGHVGVLVAAVGLMWSRIDAIEERFDRIEVQIDVLAHEVQTLSTMMQVDRARVVTPEAFNELEKRVTVLEAR